MHPITEAFDLAVVGTGEGESATATRCRAAGWRVAIVDELSYGGTRSLRNRRVREPAAMFKTIVDESTGQVLGAHLLGPDAADVINIFALAIRNGLRDRDLRFMVYAYPTSASDVSAMI